MKAVTLWQPWATLAALGVKTVETRSWATAYRGPLAIHAGARRPPMMHLPPLPQGRNQWMVLDTITDPAHQWRCPVRWPVLLPLGAVIATCTLIDCVPTEQVAWAGEGGLVHGSERGWFLTSVPEQFGWTVAIADLQKPYGDYSPGRFAWLLADIKPLPEPIPARGRQGLWQWHEGRAA